MIYHCHSTFSVNSGDEAENGRRSALDDSKLKIKTVSDSPEIRNLADGDGGSASETDDDGTPNSLEADNNTSSITKTASAASSATGTSASTTNNLNDCKKLSNNCTNLCSIDSMFLHVYFLRSILFSLSHFFCIFFFSCKC